LKLVKSEPETANFQGNYGDLVNQEPQTAFGTMKQGETSKNAVETFYQKAFLDEYLELVKSEPETANFQGSYGDLVNQEPQTAFGATTL